MNHIVSNTRLNRVPFLIGLFNSYGSSCYANSILTCLFQIRSVVTSFGGNGIKQLYGMQDNGINMLRHLNGLLTANFQNDHVSSEDQVKRLMNCIFNRSPHFRAGVQNDAQEFLTFFRQWLQEELTYLMTSFQRAGMDMRNIRNDANNALQFLNQLSVTYKETRTCSMGHQSQIQVNELLSLPIAFGGTSINACIANYFSNERLQCTCPGNRHNCSNLHCNAYNCGGCGSYVNAVCSKRIINLPDILIIHLLIFDLVNVC